MTRITYWRPQTPAGEYRVEMQGHASYSHEGPDIVCAAASALCCTLAEALSRKQRSGQCVLTRCQLTAGKTDIAAFPVREEERLEEIFQTICTGFEMFCKEYPNHVLWIEQKTGKSGGTE